MDPSFNTVTIIGVGLLGGSLGLALKKRGLAGTVRGVGRRQESLDKALSAGAIDEAFLDAEDAVQDAVQGAGLVVLCTPANFVTQFLDIIRPVCSESAIVTDVASTKTHICQHAHATWPQPRRFVGSHPMAGSEKFGPEHAHHELYEGAYVFVEENDGLDPDAHHTIIELWQGLGARVVEIAPTLHDAILARTSHVPHIVSSALARLVDGQANLAPFIGNGFRDTTRIAEGRPEIWRDISLTNRAAIGEGLGEVIEQLQAFCQAIRDGDGERLERLFDDGRVARQKALEDAREPRRKALEE